MNIRTRQSCLLSRAHLLLIFILFSFGCAIPKCPDWEIKDTVAYCALYDSGKLYYPPSGPTDELEAEIVRTFDGCRFYLNARFSYFQVEGKAIDLTYSIGSTSYNTVAYVFRGRQRLLLSGEDTDKIIFALMNGCSVVFTIDCFHKFIPATKFKEAYLKLSKVSGK